ncbi:MAG: glycogen/starch synthase, partial [Myxococcota bacterium]
MRILFVSSELTPTASTGELGEAVGALVRSLARRGHDVVAIVPAYADHPVPSDAKDLGSLGDIPTFAGPRAMRATFSEDEETSLRIVRLHCPTLYGRPGIYGAPDDFEDNPDRFWALAVGAVGALARLEWAPEIAHSHDWHAGWLPALLRSQSALQTVRTVHTCYDLQMVGLAPMEWATELGIVPELLTPEGIEYFGQLSFAKVGLRFADVAVMSTPEGSDPVDGLAGDL